MIGRARAQNVVKRIAPVPRWAIEARREIARVGGVGASRPVGGGGEGRSDGVTESRTACTCR
jgi:hypothetical protein